jgi:hypothetical protein
MPNRLAVVGEQLVAHRFPTGSLGLASPEEIDARRHQAPAGRGPAYWWKAFVQWWNHDPDPVPAVCVAPGTRLRMSPIPSRLRREFHLEMVEEVTFTQITAEAFHYRDSVRFASGRYALLQSIPEGVRFEVLAPATDPEMLPFPNRPAAASLEETPVLAQPS